MTENFLQQILTLIVFELKKKNRSILDCFIPGSTESKDDYYRHINRVIYRNLSMKLQFESLAGKKLVVLSSLIQTHNGCKVLAAILGKQQYHVDLVAAYDLPSRSAVQSDKIL